MARKVQRSRSRLLKLPAPIVRQVDRMLLGVGEERKTYQEVADWICAQGFQTSKSAVDRYAKYLFALQKVRLVGEQAQAIIESAGKDPLKIEEANVKLAGVVTHELLLELMRGGRVDAKRLGRLIGDITRLQASSVSRERLKADLRKKAESVAKDAAKEAKNMSKEELIEFVKEKFYGLA